MRESGLMEMTTDSQRLSKRGEKAGKGLIFKNKNIPLADQWSINCGSEAPEGGSSHLGTRWSHGVRNIGNFQNT